MMMQFKMLNSREVSWRTLQWSKVTYIVEVDMQKKFETRPRTDVTIKVKIILVFGSFMECFNRLNELP
jgi:hypothetical protein